MRTYLLFIILAMPVSWFWALQHSGWLALLLVFINGPVFLGAALPKKYRL